jgi:hypothetical protein
VNYKEIQNEDVALAALNNNIVEPSSDLCNEYRVILYYVKYMHVNSVCG